MGPVSAARDNRECPPWSARILGPPATCARPWSTALRAAGLEPVPDHASPDLTVLLEDAARPPWPAPPVIVISSNTDIDSVTNAITSGVAAYLTLPLDADELVAAAEPPRPAGRRRRPAEHTRRGRGGRSCSTSTCAARQGGRLHGHLIDVSGTGCRVETREKVRRGEESVLVPHALGESTGIALGATVTRTRRDDGRPRCATVAVRFNGTSALLAAADLRRARAERRPPPGAAESLSGRVAAPSPAPLVLAWPQPTIHRRRPGPGRAKEDP